MAIRQLNTREIINQESQVLSDLASVITFLPYSFPNLLPLNKALPTTAGTTHPVQLRRAYLF